MDKPIFHCRIATPSDRDKVVRLCKRAVGPHDYVLRTLDEVIERGHLFVVLTQDETLIGMANYTPVFDKSAWLGMARTDPDWRGQGVAQILQRSIAAYAKRHGVKELRLFVHSTNTSSLRAARKGNFKVVAHAAHVSIRVKNLQKSVKQHKASQVPCSNFHKLSKSKYLKKLNGYVRYRYAFVRASTRTFAHMRANNEIFCFDDGAAFVLCKTYQTDGEFSLLEGKTRDCLLNVLKKSFQMKIQLVGGFLPYDRSMIRTSQSLGFKLDEWGKHSLLFEKGIN